MSFLGVRFAVGEGGGARRGGEGGARGERGGGVRGGVVRVKLTLCQNSLELC